MNNFEKIKAMDIDEMAEFIKDEEESGCFDVDINDVRRWLKSEVRE